MFIIIAIFLRLIPASIAKSKGRSFGLWWFYGAMLFIIALPHALLMSPNERGLEENARAAGNKKCLDCAEFIKAEARRCRFCGAAQ